MHCLSSALASVAASGQPLTDRLVPRLHIALGRWGTAHKGAVIRASTRSNMVLRLCAYHRDRRQQERCKTSLAPGAFAGGRQTRRRGERGLPPDPRTAAIAMPLLPHATTSPVHWPSRRGDLGLPPLYRCQHGSIATLQAAVRCGCVSATSVWRQGCQVHRHLLPCTHGDTWHMSCAKIST